MFIFISSRVHVFVLCMLGGNYETPLASLKVFECVVRLSMSLSFIG